MKKFAYIVIGIYVLCILQGCNTKGPKGDSGPNFVQENIVGRFVSCTDNYLTISIINNTPHTLFANNWYSSLIDKNLSFVTCITGSADSHASVFCPVNNNPPCIVNGENYASFEQTFTINPGTSTVVLPLASMMCNTSPVDYQCTIILTDNVLGLTHSTIFTANF